MVVISFSIVSTLGEAKFISWHLDMIVLGILCLSVVAKIKITCAGGSSKVLRRALNAAFESMWASSNMYTLYLDPKVEVWVASIIRRISSTLLLLAASSSKISSEVEPISFANILAAVVLPVPRSPEKIYAW